MWHIPSFFGGVCVYISAAAHLSSWSMGMPGREGAGALPQQSSCKAAWLPHLNPGAEAGLGDWDRWGFPSPPSPRGQALQTLALPDCGVWVTTTHEDPSRKLICPCFLSCPGCLWQAGSGSLPVQQCGTRQIVAGAVHDTPVCCQCLPVISFFLKTLFFICWGF